MIVCKVWRAKTAFSHLVWVMPSAGAET
eukprot:COSAG06_NODE_69392_length_198_cov_15.818182_1_plen_27_part_01